MAQPVTLRCGKPESETKPEEGLHREGQTWRLSMRSVNRKANSTHSQGRCCRNLKADHPTQMDQSTENLAFVPGW